MSTRNLTVASAPHITSGVTTRHLMVAVCIALCPTLLASAFIFGWRVLLLVGVTVSTCVGFEYLYCLALKKPVTIGDFSAVVTGMILAFNLPPSFPLWMATIGSFVSIVLVKELFGGIGYNFANPALVGRIVLHLGFTAAMIDYTYPQTLGGVDALATATPLAVNSPQTVPLIDLLLGTHGGVLGETCMVALILGGVGLILFKVMSASIPVVYIGSVYLLKVLLDFFIAMAQNGAGAALAAFGGIAYSGVLYVLSGGIVFAAFFMATDYSTSPYALKGKIVFAVGFAVLTVFLRQWGKMAEGVSYALLIMNLLVPHINNHFRQEPLGAKKKTRRPAKQKKEAV